ncbi:flagellar basal body P-ring protein FlgI [Borreliella californiensis]|uniref:Flagellar P-ring protein FlgI n=1 Tax=Borreliella californiensis TaxID=373543 RepID=A0A7X0DP63_9SPIR|nr:flagellar basal body P-ring protein FlgI [Borreliella californiensis]MBB6212881.1 flagellar P-ring protein precursor FlgI [Borreliella californiensis]WKC92018.1 flagellar basal body P-ring protein FlgI [Borreliella californiensis]WNY70771.1 flagellar basal body P-ring protein FlgI [Borreliella californiensis]
MNKLMLMLAAFATSLLAQTKTDSTGLKTEKSLNNSLSESTKLREIADIYPTNTNFLTGIGIVAGLTGKGDSIKQKDLIIKILEENNIINEIGPNNIESKNIALVNVSLQVKGSTIKGSKHKACIASILDSKDLTNGILLKTNLKNNEGEIIAIASGIIKTNNKLKGSGYTLDSVIINETQNINYSYNIILKKGNYTLINRIHKILTSKKINNKIKSDSTIEIEAKNISLLEEIENIIIETNPKILIDKKNGIILASENAKIGTFTFSIEKDNQNILSKNNKTTIQINSMNLNEFILKNNKNLSNKELIQIIQAAQKINKLNGELILEEVDGN